MMKKLTLITLLLLLSFTAFAQSKKEREREERINQLMNQLSIREKVAQLFIFDIYPKPNDKREAFEDSLVTLYGAGGIIVMDGSVYDIVGRMNALQSKSKVPLLVTIDAEWGAAMRFEEYLRYPKQEQLSKLPNAKKFVYKMGRNIGKELKDLGIAVNFAPVVDVSPDNDIVRQNKQKTAIAPRSFGSDPKRVATLASAYLRGMKEEGTFGCGKHYPGIGDTYIDTHDEMPTIHHSKAVLDSVDLYPYQRLIGEGLEMIMVGHIASPEIDPSLLPMSLSKPCIENLLRGEQNYKGIVITDAIVMKGISEGRDPVEVTVEAYRAGSDILLMPIDIKGSIEAIADSVQRGVFSLDELNAKVRRVLTLKAKAGLLDKDYNLVVTDIERKVKRAFKRDNRLIKQMNRAKNKAERINIVERPYFAGAQAGINF